MTGQELRFQQAFNAAKTVTVQTEARYEAVKGVASSAESTAISDSFVNVLANAREAAKAVASSDPAYIAAKKQKETIIATISPDPITAWTSANDSYNAAAAVVEAANPNLTVVKKFLYDTAEEERVARTNYSARNAVIAATCTDPIVIAIAVENAAYSAAYNKAYASANAEVAAWSSAGPAKADYAASAEGKYHKAVVREAHYALKTAKRVEQNTTDDVSFARQAVEAARNARESHESNETKTVIIVILVIIGLVVLGILING
jgi:hypothetical protein